MAVQQHSSGAQYLGEAVVLGLLLQFWTVLELLQSMKRVLFRREILHA